MTRIAHAWAAMSRERRIAAIAAIALLVTMFLPWYGLQSLNRKTGAIYSHDINAFGDVSFVEAAIFLVAAGVIAMLLARAEERSFALPGGDGLIVGLAGSWATLLIFYRVFDRPAGNGYPVGIQWGFFLAFVAAGSLAYAGWRIRHGERPEPPVRRREHPRPPAGPFGGDAPTEPSRREAPPRGAAVQPPASRAEETAETALIPATRGEPVAAERRPSTPSPAAPQRGRPRYPPGPAEEPEQLSFEDPPERR
jgi:hypothetical protein